MSDIFSTLINQTAANWWAERWKKVESREQFRTALFNLLPDKDYYLHSDYDPQDLLLEAVQVVEPSCRGVMFSSSGLLPNKTCLKRKGNKLIAKQGYGAEWIEVPIQMENIT